MNNRQIDAVRAHRLSTAPVVPPYSDVIDAHIAMTAAADTGNMSTPDELLRRRPSGTEDHRRERIALHRWESEGGRVIGHV